MKRRDIIECLVSAVLSAIVVGILTYRHQDPPVPGGDIDVQVDSTVTQIDTTTAIAPDPADTRPRDTVYIKVYLSKKEPEIAESVPKIAESVPETHESVPETKDSVLYLPVVIEQKVYEDLDSTYRAVVSGPALSEEYGPRLDSIQVYSRTTIQYQTKTVYVEPSRWSIGLQAGYGASKDGLTPYLGVGVQYRLWAPKRRKAPP